MKSSSTKMPDTLPLLQELVSFHAKRQNSHSLNVQEHALLKLV
jgi:hypothetical protein